MAVRDVIDEGLGQLDDSERTIARRLALVYEQAYANVERDLLAVLRLIAEAEEDGEPIHIDWLRREARYRRLLATILAAYEAAGFRAVDLVGEAQRIGAMQGATTGRELLAVTPGITVSGGTVNADAVQRWVTATEPQSPIRAVLAAYGPLAAQQIEEQIGQGIASGYSPRKVAAHISELLTGDGQRANMLRLTRTEMMGAFRGAQVDQYQRMGANVVTQVEWSAHLSPRTCLYCLSMHGRRFPIERPPSSFHPNCRCTIVPVPVYEFASLRQFHQTGEQWFARQGIATQLEMMGGNWSALAAYRSGSLALADFAGERHTPLWGATGYQRTARQALRGAGLLFTS
jgi:SPP1 gp7 family putative phage head morphogenesis protein